MAARSQVKDLQEAVICSICLASFNDSVILIKCGHNFCRSCITQYCKEFKTSPPYPCPQCREPFREGEFQPNRELRNVVEIAKKIPEPRGKKACEKHEELLKLFCEVDQTLICLVCRESHSHKDHSLLPVKEAALDYKEQIQRHLESLKKQRDEILSCKSSGENTSQELLDIKGTLSRCGREKFQNPVAFSSDLKWRLWESSQRNAPLGTRMKEFKDSLSSRQRFDKANVTLDPDTAHPQLILSADRRSVRREHTRQHLPDNPERFDTRTCVLGCEGFTSGRHYWEMEVERGRRGHWAVGVARASVSRKGRISLNPEQGIWAVMCWRDRCWALGSPEQRIPFPPSRASRRIRVYLDYERGQVSFFDAGTGDPIVTFPPASFAGERIRPIFWALGSVRLL